MSLSSFGCHILTSRILATIQFLKLLEWLCLEATTATAERQQQRQEASKHAVPLRPAAAFPSSTGWSDTFEWPSKTAAAAALLIQVPQAFSKHCERCQKSWCSFR